MQVNNRFCRNCPHHRDGHVRRDPSYPQYCIRQACYGDDLSFRDRVCRCKEYVPKENLEYLEWCADKRSFNEIAKR